MNKEKKVVEFKKEDNIAIIRFIDPPLNLCTIAQNMQLAKILDDIDNDSSISVVVFCAEGKFFGAGGDAKEMPLFVPEMYDYERLSNYGATPYVVEHISELRVPTIAALDGSAYGGSLEKALACDIRIAAKDIVMSLTEIKFGSFPGAGGVSRLIELVGPSKAIEHMLRPGKVTAAEWYECGVVNVLAETGTAFDLAMDWAKSIAEMPKSGILAVKEAVINYMRPNYEQYWEKQQKLSKRLCESDEMMKNCQIFLDKKGVFDKKD